MNDITRKNAQELIERATTVGDVTSETFIDLLQTDWSEESKDFNEFLREHEQVDEGTLSIIWSKLPSHLKSKLDMKRLSAFIDALEDGAPLDIASKSARLPTAIGVELLAAIDKMAIL